MLTDEERAQYQELRERARRLVFDGRQDLRFEDLSDPRALNVAFAVIRDRVSVIETADEPAEVRRMALVELLHDLLSRVQTDTEALSDQHTVVERGIRKNAKPRESLQSFAERTVVAATECYAHQVRGSLAKVGPAGLAHIQATFTNTIVTITDRAGNVVAWASAGSAGFKGSWKAAAAVARKAMEHGLKSIEVCVKGPALALPAVAAAIRSLQAGGLKITAVEVPEIEAA